MTLHPGWKWSLSAQIVTVIIGIYAILTPPFILLKYVFTNEVNRAVEYNNEKNNDEHMKIKNAIIDFHPEARRIFYPTRGGERK